VAICGTTPDVLESAAREIGPDVLPLVCDVSQADQVEATVRRIRERFGKVDILVNNAALMLRHVGLERAARPFTELEEEVWDQVMAVNVKGPWLCARAVFPDMQAQRWGRIINIASDTVFLGRGNGAQYITSKAAVIGLTHALACEVGRHGITVNAISPGLTQSETVASMVSRPWPNSSPNSRPSRGSRFLKTWSAPPPGSPPTTLPSSPARRSASMADWCCASPRCREPVEIFPRLQPLQAIFFPALV